jgi:hypothetical protein
VSRVTDITAAVEIVSHHCTEYGCRKCTARARWSRRKKWQTRKSPVRRVTGRK